MGFKRFSILVIIRTLLAMFCLLGLAWFISTPGYHATTALLFAVLIFQFVELIRFVAKTNAEVTRFLEAARYADFSQRFDLHAVGSGFEELGNAFSDILARLEQSRSEQEEELKHLKAVIEHIPTPLVSLQANKQLHLWNSSARRLFGTNPVVTLDDLAQFNQHFPRQLSGLKVGEKRLIKINIDGMEHQLSLVATELLVGQQQERLISMQDIHNELDVAQLDAWQDLVRVLTHEIMNSITPVASLAGTTVDLLQDLKHKHQAETELSQDLEDIIYAAQTVARRSEGLTNFVSSYRRLTRLPPPNRQPVRLLDFLNNVKAIACQEWQDKGIALGINIVPSELDVEIDKDLTEQVLINLLKNAEQALDLSGDARVLIQARINKRGRAVIEISDNGPGVSDEMKHKIFVPFFTTKKEGSGVGLALTRQVMSAHGGAVSVHDNQDGGATFRLTL